ncbi:MAG: acetate--CoA ligase family protein [Candidatus Nanohaloarchaea archaeon]
MLEKLFLPDKIAVVGASREEGKTGHEVFDNLLHGFEGEVVPVNPNADQVSGEEALDETPEDADLVVVVVPAKIVPEVLEDAGEKGVGAAVVISAGFSETGNQDLEQRIVEIAEERGVDLLGPNVLGLINTENSMNASFASKMPEEGAISFMSQSGAFCTAILDYSKAEHIGFRHFVSLGNKAMLDEVDFLEHWREDEETETIISYTEGIENGRRFIQEAGETSKRKPIIMVKSGRTDSGGAAASSHTGSIAGSYEAYKAAFRKTGVIEAESSRELLNLGRAFTYQPLAEGENIAVVTNAGGPGVITTDEISEHGMSLAEFSQETRERLQEILPEEAAAENPLDVIGDAGHDRYRDALEAVLRGENVDSAIVLLTPQANTEIDKTAKTVVKAAGETGKPVMASFMGEDDIGSGVEILESGGVPDFEDPKDAVKTLKSMKQYSEFLQREDTFMEVEGIENFEGNFHDFGEVSTLFKSYGFNVALTEVAEAPMDAVEAAPRVGYPVVMKIESPDIKHKTDVGGVKNDLDSKEDVRKAFDDIVDSVYEEKPEAEIKGVQVQEEMDGLEIALGVKRDPQFGPMVMIGLGGVFIEALNDVSFGIAPVSEQEAEMMVEELKSHEVFEGARGREDIMEPVKKAVIRLGELALDHEEVEEIDLNPAIVRDGDLYITDIAVTTSND